MGAKTKKKKKSAAPLVEESEAYAKLRKWAIDGGATLDGVRESNGALVATKDIKKNGVLATLPSDLALALCDPDEIDQLAWPPLQDEINARKKRVDEVASEA